MRILQYEKHTDHLLPPRQFARRLVAHALLVTIVLAVSLAGGMAGYHWLEGLPWIDSFLNAAMILGGMGPVTEIVRPAGKWFASLYALFSGVILIASAGYLLAPMFHRFIHRFHLESEDS